MLMPSALFATRAWLTGFDDRIALSPWFFLGASVSAIVIAECAAARIAIRYGHSLQKTSLRIEHGRS